jgi:transposase
MNSISVSDLLLIIYVLVDDWYQVNATDCRKGRPGKRPELSDSEVMAIMLAMDYIPFPSERQFVAYLRANYGDLFPDLLDQSQFNRRARSVAPLLEQFRQACLNRLGVTLACEGLLDTKPIPVIGYRRSKQHSDFLGSAAYGYCASKKMHYFGYKLVTISTLGGIPLIYDLVPANTDERQAAETLLDQLSGFHLFADKGFLGQAWQTDMQRLTGNWVWTPKRKNQTAQQPVAFERWLNGLRLRIEGLFNQIQNVGRNVERLLAKTVCGLCARIVAKMTSHLLKYVLRYNFGIDVLSFSKIDV